MSIFQWFLALYIPSSVISVLYLSYFQTAYLNFAPERWPQSLPTILGVSVTLLVIVSLIVRSVAKPFTDLFNRIDNENYMPTDEEKHMALRTYKKINNVAIVANFFSFVVGNMVSSSVPMLRGFIPFDRLRIAIVFFHSCTAGIMMSMFIVFAMNGAFGEFRKKLHIHYLSEDDKPTNVSYSIFFVATSVLVFSGYNLFIFGYGFVNRFAPQMLSMYLTKGLVTLCIGIVVACVIIMIVTKDLNKRIRATTSYIESLQTGELNARIDIAMIDDFGIMISSVNKLIGTLSGMLKGLRQESQMVSDSANELTGIADSATVSLEKMSSILARISDEGEKQSREITGSGRDIGGLLDSLRQVESSVIQSSDAMLESSSSISQMADNISSVADMTKKADAVSNQLNASCAKGSESLSLVSKQIVSINEASVQVKEIVGFLQSIASQTNLLAMNAAIEAAHAGEAGQGFAVVAEEVRSLANSSQESSKKIRDRINDMVKQIGLGVQSIEHTNATFREIEAGVQENARLIESITLAMAEQQQGAQDNMKATKRVSEDTGRIKELVVAQNRVANNVGDSMKKTVESTNVMLEAINEGNAASRQMHEIIDRIDQMVRANKKSVETMSEQMRTFSL